MTLTLLARLCSASHWCGVCGAHLSVGTAAAWTSFVEVQALQRGNGQLVLK